MHFRRLLSIGLIAVLAVMPVARAHAAEKVDNLIEGAKLCTKFLPRNERKYGIPLHLLSAIATTESGRWHNGLNMALPWPWTVNVEGKGYYFDSKQEAINFVQAQKAKGISSMDVGCMQVNLKHHPDAFANIGQAFEPATNVDYAAQFLRSNYDEEKSWRKAAANYHSRTPSLGNQYIGSVFTSWQRIINKVREARLAAGSLPAPAASASDLALLTPSADSISPGLPATKVGTMGIKTAAYQPIRMRVIEVSHKDIDNTRITREQGVRVIRPVMEVAEKVKPDAAKETEIAQANTGGSQNENSFVTQLNATDHGSAKLIHVNATSAVATGSANASGPRFIFN